MTLEQLRLKHPRLIYKNYTIIRDENSIVMRHEFLLEPDIVFRPKVVIPIPGIKAPQFRESLAPYAFHLGLVEAISYWKLACPGEFVIEAGVLDGEQTRFWYDLFIHGLGEFYYRNRIDFTTPDFLTITSQGDTPRPAEASWGKGERGDLVLVGGGKDSAVTLGMMATSDRTIQTMVLNPTQAALDTIRAAGFPAPLVIKRVIDPTLMELNRSGYLNGHTPFSAYVAFLGIMVAALYGNENVIVSNEKSANEGNVSYHGMEVNHQYSKSYRFEQMFREYTLSIPGISAPQFRESVPNYFSILRPLNDIQIGLMFSKFPQFFTTFRSCNTGSKTGEWCGTCAKCAFTYLALSPYVSHEQMLLSFGADLFASPVITELIRALVGLTPVKPFECVGTRDEAKLAVMLTVEKYLSEAREVPEGLLKIKSDLDVRPEDIVLLRHSVLDDWGGTYNLPPEHQSILRNAWQTATSRI